MNHQHGVIYGAILLAVLSVACPAQAQTPSPILEMLEQVKVCIDEYRTRDELDAVFRNAPCLDDPQTVRTLVDYIRHEHTDDELDVVSIVLLYLTGHPEQILIDELERESDPWQKIKLLGLLHDFYTEEVFLALIRQFDDCRLVIEPREVCPQCQEWPPEPYRVCDSVYTHLRWKLKILQIPGAEALEPPGDPSFDTMDTYIAGFSQYWEEHRPEIIKALSHVLPGQPPLDIRDRRTSKAVPQPPERVLVEQVKTSVSTRKTRDELETLLHAAPFLHSLSSVSTLLEFVWETHAREDITAIRIIAQYMTCRPEELIMENVEVSTNPWSKVKRMYLLQDWYQERVMQTLLSQFDDCRPVQIPADVASDWPPYHRVCEHAYAILFEQLRALHLPDMAGFQPPPEASSAVMDALIERLHQYWQAHRALIVNELATQHPPTLVDVLFGVSE